jgi:hypothetical protein
MARSVGGRADNHNWEYDMKAIVTVEFEIESVGDETELEIVSMTLAKSGADGVQKHRSASIVSVKAVASQTFTFHPKEHF